MVFHPILILHLGHDYMVHFFWNAYKFVVPSSGVRDQLDEHNALGLLPFCLWSPSGAQLEIKWLVSKKDTSCQHSILVTLWHSHIQTNSCRFLSHGKWFLREIHEAGNSTTSAIPSYLTSHCGTHLAQGNGSNLWLWIYHP